MSDGPDFAQMRSLVLELQQKEADYKTQLIQMEQKALCCEEEAISLRELVANHGNLNGHCILKKNFNLMVSVDTNRSGTTVKNLITNRLA